MSRDTNDELREDRREQAEQRQEERDELSADGRQDVPDAEGSQDRRRHEGDNR